MEVEVGLEVVYIRAAIYLLSCEIATATHIETHRFSVALFLRNSESSMPWD